MQLAILRVKDRSLLTKCSTWKLVPIVACLVCVRTYNTDSEQYLASRLPLIIEHSVWYREGISAETQGVGRSNRRELKPDDILPVKQGCSSTFWFMSGGSQMGHVLQSICRGMTDALCVVPCSCERHACSNIKKTYLVRNFHCWRWRRHLCPSFSTSSRSCWFALVTMQPYLALTATYQ